MGKSRIGQDIINLYDDYTHSRLDRRTFLRHLAVLAGGMSAAYGLLQLLGNNYALAQVVPEDDGRLVTETATFQAPDATMSAYVAKPSDAAGPLPGVVVIHENRGLNPHIRDVARRVALAGYVAVAPDFLSADGGTPDDEDAARDMINALDGEATLARAVAAVAFARQGRDDVDGRTGVVGFCWGGGLVNRLAASEAGLNAAVSFYGSQIPAEDAARISAPLLLHYASLDDRINAGITPFIDALKAANVSYGMHMYEGVNHAFHNDTNAARHDPDAAKLAWDRTVAFLDAHLKG